MPRCLLPSIHIPALSLLALASFGAPVPSALAQTRLVGWGRQCFDSRWNDEPLSEIAAGPAHALAVRSDGSLVAWGDNTYGECSVPALPAGLHYSGVTSGSGFGLALRSDGTVSAWGDNTYGQLGVPPTPPGVSYVQLSAGIGHVLGLLSNGLVAAWGDGASGDCVVPAAPPGLSYVEVAAGMYFSIARLSDGSVVAWGTIPRASATCRRLRLERAMSRSQPACRTRSRVSATAR